MKWIFNYEQSFKSAVKYVKGEGEHIDINSSKNKIEEVITYVKTINDKNDNEIKSLAKFLILADNCAEALGGKMTIEENDNWIVKLWIEKLYIETQSFINPAKEFFSEALKICRFIDFSIENKRILINFVTL